MFFWGSHLFTDDLIEVHQSKEKREQLFDCSNLEAQQPNRRMIGAILVLFSKKIRWKLTFPKTFKNYTIMELFFCYYSSRQPTCWRQNKNICRQPCLYTKHCIMYWCRISKQNLLTFIALFNTVSVSNLSLEIWDLLISIGCYYYKSKLEKECEWGRQVAVEAFDWVGGVLKFHEVRGKFPGLPPILQN